MPCLYMQLLWRQQAVSRDALKNPPAVVLPRASISSGEIEHKRGRFTFEFGPVGTHLGPEPGHLPDCGRTHACATINL